MWVISLILLAVAAYFLLSALSGKNKFDAQQQATDAEIADAKLAENTTSNDAFQHAGGAPAGAASSGASLSGGSANTAATGASVAAAIASAREHTLKGVTGNSVNDIQEMIKILNLRDSDARRLAIEKDQFAGLTKGHSNLAANELTAVADKLRWMLR